MLDNIKYWMGHTTAESSRTFSEDRNIVEQSSYGNPVSDLQEKG